jgi:protein TorT
MVKPFETVETVSGKSKPGEDMQLKSTPVKQSYKICAALPNGSDPYWVAVDYGLVAQAERRGVAIEVQDAGGYANVTTQISQLENCKNSGADAVIVAAISSEGIATPVKELAAAGIPVIAEGNPVTGLPIAVQTAPPLQEQGRTVGEWMVKDANGEAAEIAYFPGPPGTEWAELQLEGFKEAIAGSGLTIATTQYGETNPSTQLNLLENTLKAYPDIKYISGNGVAAEVAPTALASAEKTDQVEVTSVYQSEALYEKLKEGSVAVVSNDQATLDAAISVDLAIEALEGKELPWENIAATVELMTQENLAPRDEVSGLAPTGFSPKFSGG